MTLKRQVALGVFWESASTVSIRVISQIASLILIRVLAPADFGLVAISSLVIGSLQLVKELGFGQALLRRPDRVDAAADTTFFVIVASSLLLYAAAFFAAPWVGSYFRSPEAVPIVRVLSLTIIFSSVGQVPYILLTKSLDFRRKITPEVIAGLIGKGIAVVLALRGLGVWALVWGEIVSSVMQSALVWFFHPYRPHLRFDAAIARELFGFGKHITGSNVLVFGITNVDDLFVGRMLGTATLGIYGVAYDYSNLPATQITRVIGRVMFPAFFRIQEEIERLRSVYFRLVHAISIVSFPVTAATVVFAESAILIVAGEKWAAAIVPLQLLSIYGLLRAVAGNMAGIMQAGNRAHWLFYLALGRFLTMLLLLYPAIKLGMAASDRLIELLLPPPFALDPKLWGGVIGVCVLSNLVSVVDFFIAAWLTNRILGSTLFDYARMFGPIFGVTLVAAMAGKLVQARALTMTIPLLALMIGGASLVLVYGLLLWFFDKPARVELLAAFDDLRRKLRTRAAPTDRSP